MGWEDVLKIDHNTIQRINDVNELKRLLRDYGRAYSRYEKSMIDQRIRQLGG